MIVAFLVGELAVAAVGWGRASRIFGLTELCRADAADRERERKPTRAADAAIPASFAPARRSDEPVASAATPGVDAATVAAPAPAAAAMALGAAANAVAPPDPAGVPELPNDPAGDLAPRFSSWL